jgi:hypothetical protein
MPIAILRSIMNTIETLIHRGSLMGMLPVVADPFVIGGLAVLVFSMGFLALSGQWFAAISERFVSGFVRWIFVRRNGDHRASSAWPFAAERSLARS